MSAPTIEEAQILVQFRDRVRDILETEEQRHPSFLLRWLRARDLDQHKAENMLRASLTWRKENGINSILQVPLDPYYLQELPYSFHLVDKYDHPIVLSSAGRCNLRKCAAEKTEDEISHFANHCFESACQAIKKVNESRDPDLYPVTQFTAIIDWKNFSYMQICSMKAIQGFLYAAAIYEAHYPEILYKCLFVNFPSFLNVVLMMVKQLMTPRTFAKFHIYGSKREEWEQACREIVDDDQFPEILKYFS